VFLKPIVIPYFSLVSTTDLPTTVYGVTGAWYPLTNGLYDPVSKLFTGIPQWDYPTRVGTVPLGSGRDAAGINSFSNRNGIVASGEGTGGLPGGGSIYNDGKALFPKVSVEGKEYLAAPWGTALGSYVPGYTFVESTGPGQGPGWCHGVYGCSANRPFVMYPTCPAHQTALDAFNSQHSPNTWGDGARPGRGNYFARFGFAYTLVPTPCR